MKRLIEFAVGGCLGIVGMMPTAIAQTTAPTPVIEGVEEEITITGERENTTPPVPGNQTILTTEDIRKQQGGTVRDLLRYEPGISVPSDNRGGLQGINIRGVDVNRVDLRVDGIRLPDGFSFGVTRLGRDYVDLETLNALNIFRGTSAGDSDSGALGGTVSFETATAKNLLDRIYKDYYTNLRGLYSGSDNTFSETFTQANRFGPVDALFIYTRRDGGDFRIKDQRFRDNAARERNNFLTKFGYQLNPQSRLELTGESFVDEVDSRFSTANLPGMFFEGTTQNLFEERRTDRKRISLGYSFDNSKDSGWLQSAKAQIYYQDVEVNEDSDRNVLTRGRVTRDQAEKDFIERSIGGSLKFRSDFKLGALDSQLTYGLEASNSYNERNDARFDIIRGNRIPQAGYPRKDYPDSNTLRISVFAQNELSFNEGKVKLIPGLRFDSYSLNVEANPEFLQKREQPAEFSETNLSPSLGLIYQPNANLILFGRYSRGFRPPL